MSRHNKHLSKLRTHRQFSSMHDSYDINTSKYSKISGIQRTVQLYYVMEGKNYYILGIVLVTNSVREENGQARRWVPRHLCLSKIKGTVLYRRNIQSHSFYKCLLNILKACRDKQKDNMIRILERDRNLSGFNIAIFLYFTIRCVDKFFSEPELQRHL